MGLFTGPNAQSTGTLLGAGAGAFFGPAGMSMGASLGGALGGLFGGGGGAKKATREIVKSSRGAEREYNKIKDFTAGGPEYLKKIVAEGVKLNLPESGRIGDDQLPAVSAELDDVDRRTLDDQNRATQFSLAGAGTRGNTRAIAAGQDSLARMRENVVRAARDRSITERDSAFGRLSSERDKEFERAYSGQTFEVGQRANAAGQLFSANLAARGGAIDQILARGDARAAREGGQAGQRASAAGNLAGALMGAASSFGGSNGGWSWGSSAPSGPGQGGPAGSVGSVASGPVSFLSNIFNTAANSRKIASQPSPMVTNRSAGAGSLWRPAA